MPFRGGFGYIGISNGIDPHITDLTQITRPDSELCSTLVQMEPQIRDKLGIAMLIDRLMQYFEIHLRQHVLPNLEAAEAGIRNRVQPHLKLAEQWFAITIHSNQPTLCLISCSQTEIP